MRIRNLGWPLVAAAGVFLIYLLSMHFGHDNEASSGAVAVRPEMAKQPIAKGAAAILTPSPSRVPTPAVGLALGTGEDEIGLAVPDEAHDGSERLEEILEIWRAAADAGVPEEALAELREATNDPDPEISDYAMRALEDLERFRESLAAEPATEFPLEEDIAESDLDGDGVDDEGTLDEERELELRLVAMDEAIAKLNDPTNADRLSSLLEVWRRAVDAGVPEEALAELNAAAYDPNPEIADSALRALEDLERFRDRPSVVEPAAEVFVEDNTIESELEDDGAISLENANEDGDLELRSVAMDTAIEGLYDPTKVDRLSSLLELWRSAGDAGVPEEALAELQAAQRDPNPEIAQQAARALEDLERFRDRPSVVEPAAEPLPEENSIGFDLDDDNPLDYEQ